MFIAIRIGEVDRDTETTCRCFRVQNEFVITMNQEQLDSTTGNWPLTQSDTIVCENVHICNVMFYGILYA